MHVRVIVRQTNDIFGHSAVTLVTSVTLKITKLIWTELNMNYG